MEEAISEALEKEKLGCAVGGGTGLRYSYVDLALTDLHRGTDVVRRVLQKSNLHKRSWLQFYDSALRDEWIGIYDDTPPPPMRKEQS